MTQFVNPTQRVAEQYAAAHRAPEAPTFEPMTLTEAATIVAELGEDAAREERALLDWLAGRPEKLEGDAVVLADAARNGGRWAALAVVWAVRRVGEGDRLEYTVDLVKKVNRPGLTAAQIRGLLNVMRATALRLAREVGDAAPFGEDETPAAPAAAGPRFAGLVALLASLKVEGKGDPTLRVATEAGNPVRVSVAGRNSNTPGHLHVTDGRPFGDNTYYGRVTPAGEPAARLETHPDVVAALDALVADPEGALVRYGRVTGTCGICGRELTNAESIARGIGPICADNLGL